MPAQEMLTWSRRSEEAERFVGWLNDEKVGAPAAFTQTVIHGVTLPIYAPVLASNLEYFRTQEVEPELAYRSADLLMKLLQRSEVTYRQDREQVRGNAPGEAYQSESFKAELRALHANLANGGDIVKIDEAYAMTVIEGIKQVSAANSALTEAYQLGGVNRGIGRLLADANYTLYFSSKTMRSGIEILEAPSIDEAVESEGDAQMPWLTKSNHAMGQMAGHIVKHARGRTIFLDNGSGSWATMANLVAGISETSDFSNVSLNGIESNAEYFAMGEDFALRAMAKITQANPGFRLVQSADYLLDNEDGFGMQHRDLLDFSDEIDILPRGGQDVAVVTANFVWHRLPSVVKERIIANIDSRSHNSIFMIGDLARNGSEANRRYFNFGNNGPLNAGNTGLRQMFESQGYRIIELGVEPTPSPIHPKLAEVLINEKQNDGHFWIAYKGGEAERIIAETT